MIFVPFDCSEGEENTGVFSLSGYECLFIFSRILNYLSRMSFSPLAN